MADAAPAPRIYVLAGTNGAGKSSIAGAAFVGAGAEYFDPDAAARRILAGNPVIRADMANAAAWNGGRRLLERAIAERLDFALETTLGGSTITSLLERAAASGIQVFVWYVGLDGADLHVARVRARVARGGHDIPEAKIRERYDRSRLHLIRLLPKLAELRLYDNTREADPHAGKTPRPILLLHMVGGLVRGPSNLTRTPGWARPIVAAALKIG